MAENIYSSTCAFLTTVNTLFKMVLFSSNVMYIGFARN